MARNNRNKRNAQAADAPNDPKDRIPKINPKDRIPKIIPQLARESRVVTKSLTFRCLCDNLDVFEFESYKDCPVVRECFGSCYEGLFDKLQTRESGELYRKQSDLENAATGFMATKDTPIPDGRKSAAMLQAMRPYLLLDKWVTVLRKTSADKSKRPIMGPSDLPGFKTLGTKSKAEAEDASGNRADRLAFYKSHSVTLATIKPPLKIPDTPLELECPQTELAPPMTDENIWSRLVKYGVNSKKLKKIGIAQYRLATMAVVVNFFIQGFFSDISVHHKAGNLFDTQRTVEIGSAENDWTEMLEDGLRWLNMAIATTLKDAMVFPNMKPPTSPCIRCRQEPENPEFAEMEKGLWRLLFDLALLKTEKSLTSHIWSIGDIAGAERPHELHLSVVQFTTPPIPTPLKRRIDLTPSDDLSRPAKKTRTADDHPPTIDGNTTVGSEDSKTPSPSAQQPHDQIPNAKEHGRDIDQADLAGTTDASRRENGSDVVMDVDTTMGSEDPETSSPGTQQPHDQIPNAKEHGRDIDQRNKADLAGTTDASRRENGSNATMDVDTTVGSEDPKTSAPGVQHPRDQILNVEEHGRDIDQRSLGATDASRRENGSDAAMDVDTTVGSEDPKTSTPGLQHLRDQILNAEEHGRDIDQQSTVDSAGATDTSRRESESHEVMDTTVGLEDPKTPPSDAHQPRDRMPNAEEHGRDIDQQSTGATDTSRRESERPEMQPPYLSRNSGEQHNEPNQDGFPRVVGKDRVEVGAPGPMPQAVECLSAPTNMKPSSTQRLPSPSHLGSTERPEESPDPVLDSCGDGNRTAGSEKAGKKQVSFEEQEGTNEEGTRYPHRDRRLSNKAQLSDQSGRAIKDASKQRTSKRAKRTIKVESENKEMQDVKVKEEELDYYDRIFSITKNAGYKFIDVAPVVIDLDEFYESFAENKPARKNSASPAMEVAPPCAPKKKINNVSQDGPKIPELERVDAPPNRMTVNMEIDGESITIHTWYEGDFKQLTAFKERFEASTVPSEDLVSRQTFGDFQELTVDGLRTILSEKHLLVTECSPVASVDDMEQRLMMERVIDIQDLYFRSDDNLSSHCSGTLQGMKDIVFSDLEDEKKRENEKQRPLNALDLPCGQVPIEIPRMRDMSFRDVVWSFLKHVNRPLYQESIPLDDFRWALYSSRNAYSTPHVDANGLCTAIAPVDCRKLWILGHPLKETLMDSRALQRFDAYEINLKDYEWVPLLIKPGQILYMKPGTVHAVVTIDPGFTIGEHYFTWANMEDSLASMFHLCASNSVLTNTSHNVAVMKTLVRLVKCWRHRLSNKVNEDDVPKLNFTQKSSVKCLAMIGTYLHVFPFIEDLERGLSPSDVDALGQATADALFLQNAFLQLFDLKNVAHGPYAFPEKYSDQDRRLDATLGETGDHKERPWEKVMHDKIFRNGQLWIVAHLKALFIIAKQHVDEKEKEKLTLHATRLDNLIPELLKHARLKLVWFNRLFAWVTKNFSTIRLDGWLDWDKLDIQPRADEEEDGIEVEEEGDIEEGDDGIEEEDDGITEEEQA